METELIKPSRGGFLRPFGCGWFIREFLSGNAPYNSPAIDPEVGSPQSDIFYHYKHALIGETASDKAIRFEEKEANKEKRPINPDNIWNGFHISHTVAGITRSLLISQYFKNSVGWSYREKKSLLLFKTTTQKANPVSIIVLPISVLKFPNYHGLIRIKHYTVSIRSILSSIVYYPFIPHPRIDNQSYYPFN